MSATWLQTARRILPRLATLSRAIRPTFHLDSLTELGRDVLSGLGVEAILWDVDGTLMAHHAGAVDPTIEPLIKELFSDPALHHAVISNCQEKRFSELALIFPDIPVLLGYETASGEAYRIRRGPVETWSGPGAHRAQDVPGELRPVRKPSRSLVHAALAELDLTDRSDAALMIGDQYFTDIASANLAGIRSVKVSPLHPSSFPTPVRISHRLESVVYRIFYGRPHRGLEGE